MTNMPSMAELFEKKTEEHSRLLYFLEEVFRILPDDSPEYAKLYDLACNLGFTPKTGKGIK